MKVFITSIIFCAISFSINAQYRITAVPFIYETESIYSYSMGNSLVAFKGYAGAHHLNPASISHEGNPMISYVKFENNIGVASLTNNWTNIYLGHTFGSFDVTTSYKTVNHNFSGSFAVEEKKLNEFLLSVAASYEFENGIRTGIGLNYIDSDWGNPTGINIQNNESAHTFSVDIGVQYDSEFEVADSWMVIPAFGASLTDFGPSVSYGDNTLSDPLPMKLRLGTGLELKSTHKVLGMNIIEVSTSNVFSKIMARKEMEISNNNGANDTSYVAMNPFKTLFKSWDAFVWYDVSGETRSTLGEQIWLHSGVEVVFIETIAVRLGFQDGGEPNTAYNYTSLGFGINLGYLQFDYTQVNYPEDRTYENEFRWQITGRIPLNGKHPKSILNFLF